MFLRLQYQVGRRIGPLELGRNKEIKRVMGVHVTKTYVYV